MILNPFNSIITKPPSGARVNWRNRIVSKAPSALLGAYALNEGMGSSIANLASLRQESQGSFPGATTSPVWNTGKYGSGLLFDGVSQYANLGGDVFYRFGTGDFSVCFLINYTFAQNETRVMVGKPGGFWVGTDSPGKIRFNLNGDNIYSPGGIWNDGAWHFVIVGRKNNTQYMYIDGVFQASGGSSQNADGAGTFVGLCTYGSTLGFYMPCQIGCVYFFNRFLEDDDRASLTQDPFQIFRASRLFFAPTAGANQSLSGGFSSTDEILNVASIAIGAKNLSGSNVGTDELVNAGAITIGGVSISGSKISTDEVEAVGLVTSGLQIGGVKNLTDEIANAGSVSLGAISLSGVNSQTDEKANAGSIAMAGIVLSTPANYQVFQRTRGATTGPMTITGTYTGSPDHIQAQIVKHGTNTVVVAWTTIVSSPSSGTFSGTLIGVPQTTDGSWYDVQIRSRDASNNVTASANGTNKTGIGILIAIAGQSNALGHADDTATSAVDLAAFYSGSAWAQTNSGGSTHSIAPDLQNSLISQYNIPVGATILAADGTNLYSNWARNNSNPTDASTLYGQLLNRITAVGGVEVICWLQGESDANASRTQSQYETDLSNHIANLRSDMGYTVPFVYNQLGNLTGSSTSDSEWQAIRNAQLSRDNGTNILVCTAHDLTLNADGVHFQTIGGFDKLGPRFAHAFEFFLGDTAYYRGPSISGAVFADGTKTIVDVSLNHRGGATFTPTSGITGFVVLDAGTPATITTAVRQSPTVVRLTLSGAIAGAGTFRYLYGKAPAVSGLVVDDTAMLLPAEGTSADKPIGTALAGATVQSDEKINSGIITAGAISLSGRNSNSDEILNSGLINGALALSGAFASSDENTGAGSMAPGARALAGVLTFTDEKNAVAAVVPAAVALSGINSKTDESPFLGKIDFSTVLQGLGVFSDERMMQSAADIGAASLFGSFIPSDEKNPSAQVHGLILILGSNVASDEHPFPGIATFIFNIAGSKSNSDESQLTAIVAVGGLVLIGVYSNPDERFVLSKVTLGGIIITPLSEFQFSDQFLTEIIIQDGFL